jgi:hypothetical protein
MQRTYWLALVAIGGLLQAGSSALGAEGDLYQLRVWTNNRGQVIDGQLLGVTSRSAHILCEQLVYDIPLHQLSIPDRGALMQELARKSASSGSNTQSSPVSSGSAPVNTPPQYQEFTSFQDRINLHMQASRDRPPRDVYTLVEYAGYFTGFAFVVGLLYRLFN